jgi:serine protease Do
MRRSLTLWLLLAALPLGACRRAPRPEQLAPAPAAEPATPRITPVAAVQESFAPVVDRLAPVVVNVASIKVLRAPLPEEMPFFSDPLLRDLFGHGGGRAPHELRQQSLGSGVIISRDGLVLTNDHVIRGATTVRVALADKREVEAKIVGADPKTDIALLRIPGHDHPFASFGDSTKVRVGDVVLAFGDPLGLGPTVTSGIISAKGRGNIGIADYEDFIQTDAAINPGNSGGPLVNLAGEVIGINTAIATSGGRGNQGLGFAVPANLAREVVQQIEAHGRVIRGWLGVAVQDVTPAVAAALGLDKPNGALVSSVEENSPAARGGMERGDVIVQVDGKPVGDARELRMAVSQDAPGTRAKLTVRRGDRRLDLGVTLGEMPSEEHAAKGEHGGPGALGVQLAPLTPELARRLDLPAGSSGAIVSGVQPGSRAEAAGLRPGDVIQEIDRAPVKSPNDVKRALEKEPKKAHLLLVRREGETHYVAIPGE